MLSFGHSFTQHSFICSFALSFAHSLYSPLFTETLFMSLLVLSLEHVLTCSVAGAVIPLNCLFLLYTGTQSLVHTLNHPLTHSPTHPFMHASIHSLGVHAITHSLTHSRTHSLTHSFMRSIICSISHLFGRLLGHAFVHSRLYSFWNHAHVDSPRCRYVYFQS